MNFATKLTVLMLGIVLTIAIGISYFVYASNVKTLGEEVRRELEAKVVNAMNKIDRYLYERYADIQMLATDAIVSSRDSTPLQITERLIIYRNTYKTYASLSVFDLNRIRIADTTGVDIGSQHQMTRYWEDVLQGKISAATDVRISEAFNVPYLFFAAPVKDETDKTFAVIVTRVSISRLYEITREISGLYGEGELRIDLINKDGLLLYSNYNRKGILKYNLSGWEAVEEYLTGETIHGSVFHEPISKEKDIFVFVREQGYLDFKGNDWTLLVHVPTKIAFISATELRNKLITILLPVIAFSVLIVLFFSRTISKPIIKLRNAANEIGEGNLGVEIKVRSRDEIGQLTKSFNKMSMDLKYLVQREKELASRAATAQVEGRRAKELEKAYKRLQEVQSMLIQVEKLSAVGQLAGGIAHEVRNPLGIILQGVNYLEKTISPKAEGSFQTLSMIKDSVKRADRIINSLLDFSKDTKLDLKPEDVNSILEHSLTLVKTSFKFKNVGLIREMKKDIPKIIVDKNKIEQVFVNVLLNAVQAISKEGKIIIRSHEEKLKEAKNGMDKGEENHFISGEKAVVVEIEDTGSGVSEENLKKIFDPFFTTKGPSGGTGLGLSVSHNIIRIHKGLIDIESQIGKGTKVSITFKIAGRGEGQGNE